MSFNTIVNIEDQIELELIGELDIYSASDFMEKVENLIEEYQKDILMDFEKLDYLDSSGLGALISILNQSQKCGAKISIRGVKPRIRKLFKITQIEDLFNFVG